MEPASGAAEMIVNANCLEVNAVEHCNLSCAGCSHLSPVTPSRVADPDAVRADLARLAHVYRAACIKIVGGEPLLHPALPALLRAVRQSGLAERISVCTNGLLLARMDPEVWRLIDQLEVSCYPGTAYARSDLEGVARAAAAHGVATRFVKYRTFRTPFLEEARLNSGMTARVYRTCQIAHHWQCHTVHEGVFYKCPQALFLPRHFGSPPALQGVRLDTPDLRRRLARYLASPAPLAACARCLGTVGRSFKHRQVPPRRWRDGQTGPAEELLDIERLRVLEADLSDEEDGDSWEWCPTDPHEDRRPSP